MKESGSVSANTSSKSTSDSPDGPDAVVVEGDVVTTDDSEVVVVVSGGEHGDVTDFAEAVSGATLDQVDELAAIRAENVELRDQLNAQRKQKKPKARSKANPLWRRVVAVALIVFAILATVSAVTVVWAKTTFENEDRFVETLTPLVKDEDVASVVSLVVAAGIVEATGLEEAVRESLPVELRFLAIPVTNASAAVIAAGANEVIQSDAFTEIWKLALRGTYKAANVVISGNDRAIASQNGQVSINLDKIGDAVTKQVESTGLELPDARTQLGSIVVYQDGQLATVQSLAQAIHTGGWLVPLIAIMLTVAAIWISKDRRRTVAILGFGTAIGLLLSLIGLRLGRNALVNAIEDVSRKSAAGATWDILLNRLHQLTWALFVLVLIVGITAWVVGPSSLATRTREWASATVSRWRGPTEDHANSFTSFIADWKSTIEVVAVMLGLLFILFGPSPSGFSVLATAAIVLAAVVAVEVLAVSDTDQAQDGTS
ncbi:MAG: hypothetical protein M3092_00030 [Actinomycetia bacterium]|nr:hypothetical protein [Actinomycetes bacterium]